MKIYQFHKEKGKHVTAFESDFILTRIIQTEKVASIGCMYLGENGIVGYHPAVVPQLLLVLNGEGFVRGEEEHYIHVQAGDAVFWEKDEWHETKSENGLTAIVIQSETLDPAAYMQE